MNLHLRPADSDAPPVAVEVARAPGAAQTIRIGERTFEVAVRTAALGSLPTGATGGRLVLTIDGRTLLAHVVRHGNRIWVHAEGAVWVFDVAQPARPGAEREAQADAAQGGALLAAMPGRVLDLLCAPGDVVQAGQTLVLLEAMKMELRLAAPAAGVVLAVHTTPGAIVERGARLVELGPLP